MFSLAHQNNIFRRYLTVLLRPGTTQNALVMQFYRNSSTVPLSKRNIKWPSPGFKIPTRLPQRKPVHFIEISDHHPQSGSQSCIVQSWFLLTLLCWWTMAEIRPPLPPRPNPPDPPNIARKRKEETKVKKSRKNLTYSEKWEMIKENRWRHGEEEFKGFLSAIMDRRGCPQWCATSLGTPSPSTHAVSLFSYKLS